MTWTNFPPYVLVFRLPNGTYNWRSVGPGAHEKSRGEHPYATMQAARRAAKREAAARAWPLHIQPTPAISPAP